jgi:hypothetical protein
MLKTESSNFFNDDVTNYVTNIRCIDEVQNYDRIWAIDTRSTETQICLTSRKGSWWDPQEERFLTENILMI